VTVNGQVSNQGLLTININGRSTTCRAPGSTSGGAVVNRAGSLNLLANSHRPGRLRRQSRMRRS
jgi:hypothetical protein